MRHIPEAGAVCGNSARTDLCGGAGGDLRPYRNRCMTRSWWAKRPAPNQTELICYKNNSWLSPHMLPYSSFYLFVFNHKASSRPHELQSADDTRVFQKTQRQVQKSYFSFFKRVINVMFNLSFDLATLLGSTCSHRDLPREPDPDF